MKHIKLPLALILTLTLTLAQFAGNQQRYNPLDMNGLPILNSSTIDSIRTDIITDSTEIFDTLTVHRNDLNNIFDSLDIHRAEINNHTDSIAVHRSELDALSDNKLNKVDVRDSVDIILTDFNVSRLGQNIEDSEVDDNITASNYLLLNDTRDTITAMMTDSIDWSAITDPTAQLADLKTDGSPTFADITINQTAASEAVYLNQYDGTHYGWMAIDSYGNLRYRSSRNVVFQPSNETQWASGLLNLNTTEGMRLNDGVRLRLGTGTDFSLGYTASNDVLQLVDGETLGTNSLIDIESIFSQKEIQQLEKMDTE